MKNGFNIINFLYTGSHKSFPIHCCLWGGKSLNRIQALCCTKCNKLHISLRCIIACFICRITQKISVILWAILQNGWKCIFNCVAWFLTLSNKVEKCLCIRFFSLSVRPSVCSLSNSCKYSSNIFKFIHDVHIWYRIDRDMYGTKCSFTESQNFQIHFDLSGGWRLWSLLQQIYIALNTIKLNISFICIKACFVFRIAEKIWYIMGYTWKRLGMYFKLCFMICFHHTKF